MSRRLSAFRREESTSATGQGDDEAQRRMRIGEPDDLVVHQAEADSCPEHIALPEVLPALRIDGPHRPGPLDQSLHLTERCEVLRLLHRDEHQVPPPASAAPRDTRPAI